MNTALFRLCAAACLLAVVASSDPDRCGSSNATATRPPVKIDSPAGPGRIPADQTALPAVTRSARGLPPAPSTAASAPGADAKAEVPELIPRSPVIAAGHGSVVGPSPARSAKTAPDSASPPLRQVISGPAAAPNPVFAPAGANGRVTQAEVDTLEAGLGQALTALEASLVADVLTETLPLTGDRFAAAYDNNVAGFRYLSTLRTVVAGGLATLTAGPDYTPAQVASPINSRLTSAGFNSSSVTVTTVNDQVQLVFVTSDSFSAASVPIGSDFGLPNLDLDLLAPANASTVIAVALNFTAGVDGSGFYVDKSAPTVFTINTTTTLSTTLNAPVRFARLPFRLNDRSAAPRTNVTANFVLSLRDPDNSDNSFKIRSGEFSGSPELLDATVAGTASLNMAVTSDLPAAAAMPKVRTDLTLTWNYATPQTVNSGDNNQSLGSAPLFALKNNSIHLNSFFNSFAGTVLGKIAVVTDPFRGPPDLIAALTAEIPLLSDLGSDAVTILDVAGASEEQVAAIAGLNALSALRNFSAADTVWVNMGSFNLNGDLRTSSLSGLTLALTNIPPALPAALTGFLTDAHEVAGLDFPLLENAAGDPDGRVLANLLLGQPADLFSYKSGAIELADDFGRFFYPVLGPFGVTLGGRAGVKTQFGFGFDTAGIFDYYDAGANATADMILNGFYAIAADENGDPFTGISLMAGVTAGVAANFVIATVGVEGDITAEIGFWLDENGGDGDGRVRWDKFASMPFEQLFYATGSLSAGLRAYAEVGIGPFSVGYDWESPRATIISFDDQDDDVPFLAEPDPGDLTKLILNVGERADRRIYGPTDDRAEEYVIRNGGSGIVIEAFHEENSFATPALITGSPNERGDLIELDPDVAVPVRLHGGDGRDIFRGGAMADELYGDAGPDKLEGRGGNDTLRGGDGNDELMGGTGADIMDGGPGEDTASWLDSPTPITLNLQTNERTGEAMLDTLISIERYKGSPFDDTLDGRALNDALLSGGPGNDMVRGHAGNDQLEGGSGDDTVEGGPGDDLINGGSGADILDGGDGMDILSYLSSAPVPLPPGVVLDPVTVNLKTGLGTHGDAAGDVVSGFEILYGSGVPAGRTTPFGTGDDLTGSDNADIIHGMGGTDLIHGGEGNDILYGDNADATEEQFLGGFDADTIYGDAGNDQIFGQNDNDKLYGGDGNDALDGGPGDDTLDGNAGNNTLVAGAGDDHLISNNPTGVDALDGGTGYNRLSADYSDKSLPVNFTVGPGHDNARDFLGGDKFSFMQTLGSLKTGGGDDIIRLAAAQEPYYYPKTVNAGAGNDLVIADWRGLYVLGQSAQRSGDNLHGGDGIDTISFEQSIGAVSVNLSTPGLGGVAAGMTMSGFENIIGSHYVDSFVGDAGNNIINPLDSPTPTSAGGPFIENIEGGGGVDTLVIDCSGHPDANALGVFMSPNWSASLPISFGVIVGQYFPFVRYTYSNMESFHLTGGAARDVFYGQEVFGSFPDIFIGLGGNDHLESRGADDYLDGGEGDDELLAGTGNDIVIGGLGNDAISFQHSDAYGVDFVDAGPGDDSVYNMRLATASASHATAGMKFQCDCGPGFDTISVDFGNQTQPIIFNEAAPTDIVFPDGNYCRNFEYIARLYATLGNDRITCIGRRSNTINGGEGNDIIIPGLGIDSIMGGNGDDLLILNFSEDDLPGNSGLVLNAGLYERRRLSDNVLLDQLFHSGFERVHFTGTSKNDTFTGGSLSSILYGGAGNDKLTGGGNGGSYLDGGPGADTLTGGSGNDTYIVDDPADVLVEGSSAWGFDTAIASVSYTLPGSVDRLILAGSAVNGTGNTTANTLIGNTQNNLLQGLGGNDTLNGGGGPDEIDRLNGGTEADTFILGDGNVRFYDDGNPSTPGLSGYAIIEDFTPSQNDRLRLTGSAAQYFLGVSPVAGVSGTALYHDSNGNGVLDTATDELIAIIISPVTLTPANTLTPGTYPAPVTPETIGLTAPLVVTTLNDPAGSRLQLQFVIKDPMPAGALLEIQASSDLGINDPWQTIASKNGSAAWTGLAPPSVSDPANGQVTVTFTDLPPTPGIPRRFLRFRLAAP